MELAKRMPPALDAVAVPFVKSLALRVTGADLSPAKVVMPIGPAPVHGGRGVGGQSWLAAADTAMVLAASAEFGEFRPMTTVQLQTSVLRPVPGDAREVTVHCRVLRRGQTLAIGDTQVTMPDGKPANHATTACALL